ncbi:testis-specific Y-encoded protein 2-like [Molossus nigricans]
MLGEGEEVFPDLGTGRQEDMVPAELVQVEEEEEEAVHGPESEEQGEEEKEACQGKLIAGQQTVPHGEDIVKVVETGAESQPESEAETKQQEEKSEERAQAQSGQGGQCTWSALKGLQALQSEMEPVNEQASKAFSRLKRMACRRRRPYLELRSTHIEHIPGFWAKAFVSHPDLSAMICEQDEKMLSHMMNLKVEEVQDASDCCKILLFFHKNPYFCNNVIVKEYLITLRGYRVFHCTPIQWSQYYERQVYRRWHQNSSLNFFNWFSDHNVAGSGRIAEGRQYWIHVPLPATCGATLDLC